MVTLRCGDAGIGSGTGQRGGWPSVSGEEDLRDKLTVSWSWPDGSQRAAAVHITGEAV